MTYTSLRLCFDDQSREKTEDVFHHPVWNNGDTINGTLHVSTPIMTAFDICVVLEGIVKVGTAENGHNFTIRDLEKLRSQHQFLRVCQHFNVEPTESETRREESYAFQFTIPNQLYPSTCITHQQTLQLPPTLRKGDTRLNMMGEQSVMQPSVSYFVHAKLKPRPASDLGEAVVCYNTSREIIVRPFNPAAPPLVVEHFPYEFTTASRSPIKQQRWQNDIGEITIAMSEPLPLNLYTSTPKGGTFGLLHVNFLPRSMHYQDSQPGAWTVSVTSWLNIKTFCTTKQITNVPSFRDLARSPHLVFDSKLVKLERREFHRLPWKYNDLPVYSKTGTGAPSIGTSIILPISVSKSTQPTFMTPLFSRSYSLKIRVKIVGVRHQDLLLEVPLQIINDNVERRVKILEELPLPDLFWSDDSSSESVSLEDDPSSPPIYDQCNHHLVVATG